MDCVEVFAGGEGGCGGVASAGVEGGGLERGLALVGGVDGEEGEVYALPLFARW